MDTVQKGDSDNDDDDDNNNNNNNDDDDDDDDNNNNNNNNNNLCQPVETKRYAIRHIPNLIVYINWLIHIKISDVETITIA